jgi:hypothetical protein
MGPDENFRRIAVLLVPMSRLLVILTLLAAALPAAARAQTPVEQPVAVTGAADSLTETTANLNGSVDPNGTATTYHFEYGTSAGYGLVTPEADAGAGTDPVAVEAPITGLTRNTAYHYRLVATNGTVPVFGADRTLRTATGPVPPRVKATGSREVQSRSALLITQVDPNAQATTVRFEYGRSTGYGSHTATIDAGKTDGYKPFSMAIDRLRPNTRYHFRAVATNAAGTTRSLDRSFVTTREPTGISVALAPNKVTWGQDLTVIGRIRGVAVGGTGVALERQSFPFQSGFSEVARKTAKSDGTFQFNVNSLFQTTHYRVVTLTKTPIASRIYTASSAVKVHATGRSLGRRRARIRGAIWPRVPNGRVQLKKRSPRGRWVVVKRSKAKAFDANRSRYSFKVKRTRKRGLYRVTVLPDDGGAHIAGRSKQVRVKKLPKKR